MMGYIERMEKSPEAELPGEKENNRTPTTG
jgi:hypothetical protein